MVVRDVVARTRHSAPTGLQIDRHRATVELEDGGTCTRLIRGAAGSVGLRGLGRPGRCLRGWGRAGRWLRDRPRLVVARVRSGVCEAARVGRHELPAVAPWVESQPEDAERVVVLRPNVRDRADERMVVTTPGADDEFAYPVRRIGSAGGRLRRPALVVVVMAGQDDLRA